MSIFNFTINIGDFLKKVGLSLGWILFIGIILLLFLKPDLLYFWISRIQNLFLWFGTGFRKKQIENVIKANFLRAKKEVTKDIEEVLPYDLKIQWVTKSNRDAFFDGKNVVVCMDNKRNKLCTVVHTINDYVNNGLLVKEKACLDDKLHKSSCLVMTRKLLMSCYENGVTYFFDEILNKEIKMDIDIENGIKKLISLDDNGLFTQVLLREIKDKSTLVYGKLKNKNFNKETKEFINFLCDIALRNPGDDTQLSFNRNYYKVAIMLVADKDQYNKYGETIYIERYKKHIIEGKNSIYLCARNTKIRIAKKVKSKIELIKQINSYKINISIKEFIFQGRKEDGLVYPGICIHTKIKKERLKRIKQA